MKKSFVCSLCHNGILGGALYLDDNAITFKTNKLTVSYDYRNIVLPLSEIKNVEWKRIIFPIATFYMACGKKYTLLIFNKKRFVKYFNQMRINN
jgi:hypothetical protein